MDKLCTNQGLIVEIVTETEAQLCNESVTELCPFLTFQWFQTVRKVYKKSP